jgi:hypothetical protein
MTVLGTAARPTGPESSTGSSEPGAAFGYLAGQSAETFSLDAYLARFDPRMLASAEGRRVLTRLDPLLWAIVYFRHHLVGDATGGVVETEEPDLDFGTDPVVPVSEEVARHVARHVARQWLDKVTFADPHLDWCRQARRWVVKSTGPRQHRDAYVAPRELGKSTWFFLILPMWAAAHGHRKFIAAFSDSSGQAETHLQTFKHELDNNRTLRHDFPKLCRPAVRNRGVTASDTKGMYIAESGFVFAAKGIDTSSLGLKVGRQRPDLLLLDDIEPGEDKYSEYQVEGRLKTVLDVIFPLSEYARVVIVGTVTMPGSIVHQLVKSVTEAGEDPEDWIAEQNIRVHYYPPIITRVDGSERSIWPAKWSMAFLAAIRHTRSYLKNFANSPLGADGDYWTLDDFAYGALDGTTRVLLSVDPAVTTSKNSDYTGLAIVAWQPPPAREQPVRQDDPEAVRRQVVGRLGLCEVRYAAQVKLTGAALRKKILELLAAFPEIGLVIVEDNQGKDLWLDILHHLPVKLQCFEQTVKKEVRAAELLAHYQRGRVTHTRRHGALEEQMVAFPKAAHDDMVDAVGSAVCRFLKRKDPAGVKPRGRSLGYA